GNHTDIIGEPGSTPSVGFLNPRIRVNKIMQTDDSLYVEDQLQVGIGLPRHELFDLDHAQLTQKAGRDVVKTIDVERTGNVVIGQLSVKNLRGPSRTKLSESLT